MSRPVVTSVYAINSARVSRGEKPLTFEQIAEEARRRRDAKNAKFRANASRGNEAQNRLRSTLLRAQKIGHDCDLDCAWIAEKLLAGHCEATGIKFVWGSLRDPWHPTIDRKDSSLGYTKDNCQMVVWMYNRAKQRDNDAAVLQLARALVEFHTSRP